MLASPHVAHTQRARTGTQQSSIEYDAADRPTKTTRPSGKELELTYDSAGRVQHTEADDGTSVQSEFQTTGARNPKALETDAGVRTGLSFDGPLLTSISTRGDGADPAQESQVSLTYDNSGRPASETIDGDTQSFSYNNDDQPTQIGPLQIGYDPSSGDATSITAGTTVSRFDTSDRGLVDGLSAAVQGSSGETPVFTEQVVRDKLGRIAQRTTTIGTGSPSVSAYSYDDAGRLTEVKTNGLTTETYGYNNTGGLTSRGNGVLSNWIATDGYGRPTSAADGTTAAWSTDGELISLSAPGQTASTLTYDGFGRIKTIAPQGGPTGTYEYDGMGRRVALRVGGQIQRRYLYGGGQFPRARLDADGDALERYVYGPQSHVPELIVRRDGQRLRLFSDLTGSVRLVLDADTGAVVQQLAFDAYGRTTLDTNPGTQPFGFKGALADPVAQGAGLVWMGSRAYLPSLARFSTAEPEGVSVAWNQHDALGGDPINLADVTGFAPSAGTVANTSAGVGDALLGVFCFGFCNPGAALRRWLGMEGDVDMCSLAYNGTNIPLALALPVPGGKLKGLAKGIDAAHDVLATPKVASTKLQNLVNNLYKGTTNPNRVGNGTTMDALRSEIATGKKVGDKWHLTKAKETLAGINNWLDANPNASAHDLRVANSLKNELESVLRGH